MRKVIFGGANSLDNFIARPDGAFDWLLWSDETAALMAEFWKKIDTILMGRKTHDVAVRNGQGGDGYPGVKTFVFSRTMPERSGDRIIITARDAAEVVRELKREQGKDIFCMGGGELARSLLEEDLIDELSFNIQPVLLGSGIPLFHPMTRQRNLELIECKPLKNGCVSLSYRVKRAEATR